MSFFSVAIKMPKAISITFLVNMLSQIKLMVMMALTHLGLYNPPEHEDYTWENPTNYVLILDGSSPSLVPIPVHIVTASIKKRLQVVPYAHFMEKILGLHKEEGEEENKVCAVCLDCIESSHEIRVLCNCCHVFHRECLDHWVDEGQVTCPLCRSMLLPPEGNLNLLRCGGNGGDPWMVERNGQLLAEDQVR